MRDVLFRGKDRDENRWYEGFCMALSETTYCFSGDYAAHPENTKHYIVFDQMTDWGLPNKHMLVEVIPETVGQYTGLKDRNGRRIFEQDIIECWSDGVCARGTVQQRKDGLWIIFPAWQKNIMWGLCPDEGGNTSTEVIGNIHDNPELAEEE